MFETPYPIRRRIRRSPVHVHMVALMRDYHRILSGLDKPDAETFYNIGFSVGGTYAIITSYEMTTASRARWMRLLRVVDEYLAKKAAK